MPIKLSKKELKKLKKRQEFDLLVGNVKLASKEEDHELGDPVHSGMEQFAISQADRAGRLAVTENQLDIKVERFSIGTKGKDLFVNASLQITHGRRYGLVGPNG